MPVPFSGLSRGNSTRECDQAAYEDWQSMLHNKPPLETRGGHLSEWSGPTQGLNIRPTPPAHTTRPLIASGVASFLAPRDLLVGKRPKRFVRSLAIRRREGDYAA